jgi:hypothetical protein
MNAAIRAVARTAIARKLRVIGFERGYAGLLANDHKLLDARAVGGIMHQGGTFLRTSISSSVRGKLTTIVSPLSGLMGSLVAPLRWLVGEHVRQNSLCKTLRLTHAFSRVSGPAMPTRKICNSRVLISASMRCRVWDTPL